MNINRDHIFQASPMLTCFVHILTVFAMLLHSIGGCCLHHSHEQCPGHEQQSSSVVKMQSTGCSHAHHHHSDHDETSESPASSDETQTPCDGDHTCDDQSCVYNKTTSTEVAHQMISPFIFKMTAADVLGLNGPETLFQFDGKRPADGAESSLSRCALTQSWQL